MDDAISEVGEHQGAGDTTIPLVEPTQYTSVSFELHYGYAFKGTGPRTYSLQGGVLTLELPEEYEGACRPAKTCTHTFTAEETQDLYRAIDHAFDLPLLENYESGWTDTTTVTLSMTATSPFGTTWSVSTAWPDEDHEDSGMPVGLVKLADALGPLVRAAEDDPSCDRCLPSCDGLECGYDGCDGFCGSCAEGASCVLGQCLVDGAVCADDDDDPWDGCQGGMVREAMVNTTIEGTQQAPEVAVFGDGSAVVVWESCPRYQTTSDTGPVTPEQDGSRCGVFARHLTIGGAPTGEELQVNTATMGDQWMPRVAVVGDDAFAVVWKSCGKSPEVVLTDEEEGFFYRRFDGTSFGAVEKLPISSYCPGYELAMEDNGDGVQLVVSGPQEGLVLGPDGAVVANDITIFPDEPNVVAGAPSIALMDDGAFLVAVTACGNPEHECRIIGQLVGADGALQGEPVTFLDATGGLLGVVGATPLGGGLVHTAWVDHDWPDYGGEPSSRCGHIEQGLFSLVDGAMGASSMLSSFPGSMGEPQGISLSGGGAVVAWSGPFPTVDHSPSPEDMVAASILDQDGSAKGPAFALPTTTTATDVGLAPLPDGGFIAVWSGVALGDEEGASGVDVFVQRFDDDGARLVVQE